eukprot:757721-Hanusia_phi.AAC.4
MDDLSEVQLLSREGSGDPLFKRIRSLTSFSSPQGFICLPASARPGSVRHHLPRAAAAAAAAAAPGFAGLTERPGISGTKSRVSMARVGAKTLSVRRVAGVIWHLAYESPNHSG